MQDKRLGRGLKEISDIFLSTGKDNPTIGKKREETCESCCNLINDPEALPKCTVYTVEDQAHGVCHKETIDIADAHNCDYFKPIISSYTKNQGEPSDLVQNMCEVEENVTIEKNISYPNTPDAQHHMIEALCNHLKEDFSIKRIELVRTNKSCAPGNTKTKEEKITIYIEDEPSLLRI